MASDKAIHTDKEHLYAILSLLDGLTEISYRPMMGEYVLYYKGKVIGGIYDNVLLLKPTKTACEIAGNAEFQIPYEGAKPMLRPDTTDKEKLVRIVLAVYEELPEPKPKKRK